jgi:glycosyltransferase involved in cell wall biosynthesis
MKIGVLVKPMLSNAAYRAIGPMRALGRRGHEVVMVKRDLEHGRFPARELAECDVVHVYRGYEDPQPLKCIAELRRRGIAITWDDDDDVRLFPSDSPGYKALYGGLNTQRLVQQQIALAAKADVVTTTNQTLADLFAKNFEGPIEVIENFLQSAQYARNGQKQDGVTVGWVAGREHMADVRLLDVTSMLCNVMERDKHVRVATVGVKLDIASDRYTHIPRIEFPDLGKFLAQLDIGIAPIADHPMSYARSNVKVKEYAAAGVPWVASTRGPYVGLGAKEGGVTVADDRWEQVLLDLAGSRRKRMRLGRKAASWGESQHIDQHAQRWEAVLQKAVELAGRRRT